MLFFKAMPHQQHNIRQTRDIFRNISTEEASGQQLTGNALTARRAASSINFGALDLNLQQSEALQQLYQSGQDIDHKYHANKDDEQALAAALLANNRLDDDERESSRNRWVRKWSRVSGGKGKETRRVLFQWCAY